ncbi:MAG: hypothetical protein JWM68_230 [Verrucomicrobiales bacterium]|nr:hypothetical protein [Verrucomicrobiales bacterium]
MQTGSKIFGNHAFFAREGDAIALPAVGVVGRSSKPDPEDNSYVEVGLLEKDGGLEIEKKQDDTDIFAPTPGVYRLYDVISTNKELNIMMSTKEFSPLAFQLLFGTANLTALLNASSGANKQFNPLGGIDLKGWLQVEQYDQTDTLANFFEVYGRLEIDGSMKFNGGVIECKFKFRCLHSQYNSGVLA